MRTVTEGAGLTAAHALSEAGLDRAPEEHPRGRATPNRPPIELIAAPSSLGLRPPGPGREPGTWRAPAALLAAGLATRLRPARLVELPRPPYAGDPQPGTRILNGLTIREHALTLAAVAEAALAAARFTVVLGGDCSVLLGCLLGARRAGRCGLVHVDGHADFAHPGTYDTATRLGTVAGMDLALATGRGELLLTHWPQVGTPLVADDAVFQIGARDAPATADAAQDAAAQDAAAQDAGLVIPPVAGLPIEAALRLGPAAVARRALAHAEQRGLERLWLHVDVDVLDERTMPAVDSPGRPGFDFPQLAVLIAGLVASGRVLGLDLTIYDPERDAQGRYAAPIAACLASGLDGAPA